MTGRVEAQPRAKRARPGRSRLQNRLGEYVASISFEKGVRPVGLLNDAERADLAVAESQIGLDRGLLLFIDRALTMISPTARADFARALSDVTPETPLQPNVVGGLVVWMLTDPEHGARAVARNAAVSEAIAVVADAQRRTLDGETLTREQWSQIRKAATTTGDPEQDGRASLFAGMCAEAAAWSPASSPSVAAQTLEPWSNISGGIIDAQERWTLADYDLLQTAMAKVWEQSAPARARGERPDLDAIMQLEAPEQATRWNRHVTLARALSANRMAAICQEMLRLLKGSLI